MNTTNTTNNVRYTATVPTSEIEPLINQLREVTGSSEAQIFKTLGFEGNSYLENSRKRGLIPLRTKYAMRGLLADLNVKPEIRVERQFTIEELTDILLLLRGLLPAEQQRLLLKKIVSLIGNS